ncbi:MAG TPA: PEP-CTERM sorting domain-containing protein [Candidatus Dormibacteraeota bacterium]|jgi:hypothetical protein|nr:PEP-CTERM sorting domain-containing protein [Candidatus Dormibacteraeota bacterium]
MTKIRCAILFSFLVLLVFSTIPTLANGIKADLSASGKGQVNPSGGCTAANIDSFVECVNFDTSGAVPTWTNIVLNTSTNVVTTTGPFDIFLVNGITTGTQVTLTLTGASDVFGSFFCGNDPTMTAQLGGFCADPNDLLGEDASGIFSQVPDGTGAQQTFVFNGSAPGSWVFYATAGDATISTSNGGTTSAPEPGTLLLVVAGAGLLAIGKLRRA